MEDSEAVKEVQLGNLDAFKHLYSNNKLLVLGVVQSMIGISNSYEDFIQEIFSQAYLKIHQFRGDAQFSTWLYRIAVNHMLMAKRKGRLSVVSLEDVISDDDGETLTYNDIATKETGDTLKTLSVRQALDKLSDEYKKIAILYFIEGLSTEEVAETLGISAIRVKNIIYRVRKTLKAEL